jgi:predicted PhzF superfamily epimerase YddE/YHI9
MQRVAMEMNQAETAFVHPEDVGFRLRWFTPTVEVDLCGHATLATAHVLFSRGFAGDLLRFQTRSGELTAARAGDQIELDFPAEPPVACELPAQLEFLGPVGWSGKNRMDWFVTVPTAARVRELAPDFAEIASMGMRGLIVTAADEGGEFDFVSRCFFPQSGVAEDSVTGSAHCALAAYWSQQLGKEEMVGYQASERGGVVSVTVEGARVKLRGRAVTTLEGTFQA